jgi:hypothetical protein
MLFDWLFQPSNKEIIMKLSELAAAVSAIDAKLSEASDEIVGLINDLRNALADAEIPAEAAVTLDALAAKANSLADIVPDEAPVE